jgi:hypothetical protein
VPYLSYLALREVSKPVWTNVWHCADAEPWGAGFCIRRAPAMAYMSYRAGPGLHIEDRVGLNLLAGADSEMAILTCQTGLGMGLFPQLRILHLIPRRRVQEDYLVRLIEGSRTSSLLLFYKWGGEAPEKPYSLRSLGRLLRAALLRRGIDRKLYFASFRAKKAAWAIIRAHARKEPDAGPPGAVSYRTCA